MPLFNFKKQFADDVEQQIKRQTIRAPRKDGRDPQVGQTAHCYTGLRTANSRLLGKWKIYQVRKVLIGPNGVTVGIDTDEEFTLTAPDDLDIFATADGFKDWPAMCDWFQQTHGFPFEGFLSRW